MLAQELQTVQLANLRELAELNMQSARAAAHYIRDADPATREANAASLTLTRATNAVTRVIALETRIANADPAEPPAKTPGPDPVPRTPADPRRATMRQVLHKAAEIEPDRNARAQLRRDIDHRIEAALAADPDYLRPIGEPILAISREFGLPADVAKFPDAFLRSPNQPPRPKPEDTS